MIVVAQRQLCETSGHVKLLLLLLSTVLATAGVGHAGGAMRSAGTGHEVKKTASAPTWVETVGDVSTNSKSAEAGDGMERLFPSRGRGVPHTSPNPLGEAVLTALRS